MGLRWLMRSRASLQCKEILQDQALVLINSVGLHSEIKHTIQPQILRKLSIFAWPSLMPFFSFNTYLMSRATHSLIRKLFIWVSWCFSWSASCASGQNWYGRTSTGSYCNTPLTSYNMFLQSVIFFLFFFRMMNALQTTHYPYQLCFLINIHPQGFNHVFWLLYSSQVLDLFSDWTIPSSKLNHIFLTALLLTGISKHLWYKDWS